MGVQPTTRSITSPASSVSTVALCYEENHSIPWTISHIVNSVMLAPWRNVQFVQRQSQTGCWEPLGSRTTPPVLPVWCVGRAWTESRSQWTPPTRFTALKIFTKNLPLVAASVSIPSCQNQGRKRLSGLLPWIKVFMFSAIDVKIVDCCCRLRLKVEDVTLWTSISYVKTAMPSESRPCLLKWPQSYELQYFIKPEAFHGDIYLWIPH